MQPLINPNYFYQNPYPMFPQQTAGSINGRLVDSFDSITANDVPMSGFSVFPKSDLSEVVLKRWTPNGTIQTILYNVRKGDLEPQTIKLPSETETSPYDVPREKFDYLNDLLEQINSKLDKLVPATSKKGTSNEPKSDNK